MLNSAEDEIFSCAQIIGILTFMSRNNYILGLTEPEKAESLDILVYFVPPSQA